MKITLDPGHGGVDPGGRTLGRKESFLVLDVQPFLWKALADLGYTVSTTRVSNITVPLAHRSEYANLQKADCFISLHANANEDSTKKGPWTLFAGGSIRGSVLAMSIQEELAGVMGGSKSAAYPDGKGWTNGRTLHVLQRTRMPAVLVEMGFMTNLEDLKKMEAPAMQEKIAAAIARGVQQWRSL